MLSIIKRLWELAQEADFAGSLFGSLLRSLGLYAQAVAVMTAVSTVVVAAYNWLPLAAVIPLAILSYGATLFAIRETLEFALRQKRSLLEATFDENRVRQVMDDDVVHTEFPLRVANRSRALSLRNCQIRMVIKSEGGTTLSIPHEINGTAFFELRPLEQEHYALFWNRTDQKDSLAVSHFFSDAHGVWYNPKPPTLLPAAAAPYGVAIQILSSNTTPASARLRITNERGAWGVRSA